ncbi:hypothetical protein MKW94_024165 [Papaver nudicaule]|uniref:Uncharacterized protein n=1 Tax=Papaver nudicaule TaxID=74823 RepID=A0AA41VBT8_PAPNU|nr:hypothetical protein [Papaver nudicaule]
MYHMISLRVVNCMPSFFFLFYLSQDLFTLDDCRQKDTLSIADGMFRNKKATWKRGKYKTSNTHAQNLAGRPKALTEGEWTELVKHWDGAEHQIRGATLATRVAGLQTWGSAQQTAK